MPESTRYFAFGSCALTTQVFLKYGYFVRAEQDMVNRFLFENPTNIEN